MREQEEQEEQEQEELQRKNSFPDLDDEDFLPEVDQRCVITPPSTVPRSFGRLENQLKKPELTCISEEVTPHRHCHCCHFNHHHRESPTWSCLTTFWTSSKYWRTSPAVTRCSRASGGQAHSEANTQCCVILVFITTYHHHTTTTSHHQVENYLMLSEYEQNLSKVRAGEDGLQKAGKLRKLIQFLFTHQKKTFKFL